MTEINQWCGNTCIVGILFCFSLVFAAIINHFETLRDKRKLSETDESDYEGV